MGSRLRRHDRGQLQSDTLELASEPSDTNPGLLNTPSLAEEAAEPLGRADFDDENYDDEYGLEMDYIPDDTEFAPFERENAFDYRPGGFHPVILGDFLDPDQRFRSSPSSVTEASPLSGSAATPRRTAGGPSRS